MADYERKLNHFITTQVKPEDRAYAEHMLSPFRQLVRAGKPPHEALAALSPTANMEPWQIRDAIDRGQLQPGLVHPKVLDAFRQYILADTGVREGVGPFFSGVVEPFKGLYTFPRDIIASFLSPEPGSTTKAITQALLGPIIHGGSEVSGGIRDVQQGDVGQGLTRALLGATEAVSLPAMFVSPLAAGTAMAASAAGLHGLQKYRDTGEFPVSSTLGEAAGGTLMAALGGGRGTPTNIAQEAAETASALPRAIVRGFGSRLPFGEDFRAGVLQETVSSPAKTTYEMLKKAQRGRGLWPKAAATDPYKGQITAIGHLSQMVSGARRFVGEILGAKGRRLDKVEFWEMHDPYTGSRYIVNTRTGEVLDAFPPDVAKIRQSRELFKKPVHDAEELAAAAHGVKEILWKRYEKLFLDPFGHEPLTKADFDALRQNLLTRTDILKAEDIAALQKTYNAKQLPFKTVRDAQQRLQVLNAELENYYRATREKPAVTSKMQIDTRALQAEADAIRELLRRKAQELIQKNPERALAMLPPEARAALPDIATLANYVSDLPKSYGDAKLLAHNLTGRYRLGWEGIPPGEEHAMIERIRFNLDEGPVTDFKAYASAPGIIRRLTTISPRNVAARTAGKMLVSLPELAEEVPFRVPVPSPGGPVGRAAGRIAARTALSTPARMGQHQISKKQKEE